MEASGTSGMKAAINGTLNLSVLDGWWVEGYNEAKRLGVRITRWQSRPGRRKIKPTAVAFYDLMEDEVVPAYYDRNKDGVSDPLDQDDAGVGRVVPG